MLIYGDKEFEIQLGKLARHIIERVEEFKEDIHRDLLRKMMIHAGQLEQAIWDALTTAEESSNDLANLSLLITNASANLFLLNEKGKELAPARGALVEAWRLALASPEMEANKNRVVRVKVPEGFEYYALFPEQYVAAAAEWLKQLRPAQDEKILIIGLRSIGTTLSALVQACLTQLGYAAERITVRPEGDPYSRKTVLPPAALEGISQVIVVDEGPGASGSSMASVVEVLLARGIPHKAITLFPGHGGMPGAAATEAIRQIWNETRIIATPLERITWRTHEGKEATLPAMLLERVNRDAIGEKPYQKVKALGPGEWRALKYEDEQNWPAIAGTFERLKYCCDGKTNLHVLWKFAGFGSFLDDQLSTFEHGLANHVEESSFMQIPIIDHYMGFAGMRWVDLHYFQINKETSPPLIKVLANYLAKSKGPPMDHSQAAAALEILSEMAFWNMKKTVGDEAADQLKLLASNLKPAMLETYTDGRMAPHEWSYNNDYYLIKHDWFGHQYDHTRVGRQSLLWDIAGTVVEWRLDEEGARKLKYELLSHGLQFTQNELRFYKIAYALFKYGLFEFSAAPAGNQAEQERTATAKEYYRKIATESLNG
ncbi:MAG: hypothetical protein ACO1QB_01745 [Verrucomicrobiales bacterium]